jgi:hypothetical protein
LLLQERCDDQVVPVTKRFRSHKAVREIRHQRLAIQPPPQHGLTRKRLNDVVEQIYARRGVPVVSTSLSTIVDAQYEQGTKSHLISLKRMKRQFADIATAIA